MNSNLQRILYNACTNGNGEIVKLLIRDPSLDLEEGLLQAIQNGHSDIVHTLLATGRVRSLREAYRIAFAKKNNYMLRILHKHSS